MKFFLFNSLTKRKESFEPIDIDLIKMYVCGPTIYDRPHIGNARSIVVYDVLYRVLMHIYGQKHIKYVRNITDIDDKIMQKSLQDNISIHDLTTQTLQYFHDDMRYIGCLSPTFEPKATEHVDDMIDIIQILLDKNIAYKMDDHIYFDITKAKDYTKLSGRSLDQMLDGVRVENNNNKKHPGDFVLWKPSSKDDDPACKFQGPFGVGRPGWHIECSAMSYKYLGESFDIHGGGVDLIFPHHTNEIAQTCSAFDNAEFAKIWVHNGFLTVDGNKMSKSLGNFITVQDICDQGISGEVLRLFLLSGHYRKPIDYNKKSVQDCAKMLRYWYGAVKNTPQEEFVNLSDVEMPQEFLGALLDDLNTSYAIKVIHSFAKQAHKASIDRERIAIARKLVLCARFIGLMLDIDGDISLNRCDNSSMIEQLIADRVEAKRNRQWLVADEIREKINNMDVVVKDHKDGTSTWYKKHI